MQNGNLAEELRIKESETFLTNRLGRLSHGNKSLVEDQLGLGGLEVALVDNLLTLAH